MRDEYKQFNCYEVLGIVPAASPEEIKSAYKRASLAHHPDRTGGSGEMQMKINLAKEVLLDPVIRQAHDKYWEVFARSVSSSGSEQPRRTAEKYSSTAKTQPFRETYSNQTHGGLKQRVEEQVEKEKNRILADLDNRTQKIRTEIEQALSKSGKKHLC